jgi:AraC family transcriptional activator of pobA
MKKIPVRQLKTSQEEPILLENFSIRDIQDLLAGKDMVQEIHRHDYFLIFAFKSGSGSHEIDFTSYEICDNSFFLLRPGQVHQLTIKEGSTGYLMQFNTDFYYPNDIASGQLLRRASSKNLCQLDAQRVKKLFAILGYIFQEYSDKQEGYKEVIKANIGIFFIEFVRHRHHKGTSDNSTPYTQERMEKLLELLENNISKIKQVSIYAEMLHMTTYQLNAITKSTLNKTCSDLINEHIILEAKRNLLATSNQVNQIADLLGYEDISYFIRFFKKHTGYSPEVFRKIFK